MPEIQHIETLQPFPRYSRRQIMFAFQLAQLLDRGRFVLAEAPEFP